MNAEQEEPADSKPESEDVEKSPDQLLGEIIGKELVTLKFTTTKKRETLEEKIATGLMTAEDWRTLAAASLQAEAKKKAKEKATTAAGDKGGEENG